MIVLHHNDSECRLRLYLGTSNDELEMLSKTLVVLGIRDIVSSASCEDRNSWQASTELRRNMLKYVLYDWHLALSTSVCLTNPQLILTKPTLMY